MRKPRAQFILDATGEGILTIKDRTGASLAIVEIALGRTKDGRALVLDVRADACLSERNVLFLEPKRPPRGCAAPPGAMISLDFRTTAASREDE